MASFLGELKRRNVVKVAIAYAIVGWLMIEVAATMLPIFGAPEWILQVFTFFVILGFPVALVLSWIYDVTPAGIERTTAAAEGAQIAPGSKLNVAIIGLLVITVAYLAVDRYVLNAPRPPFAGAEVNPASLTTPVDEPPAATLPIPPPPVSPETSRERLPNSVAVLPFENLSPDPDNAYFAAGVHEEILNQLAKLGALNVISRTSMLRYADTDLTIPEIAAQLNVETVMEGSVRYADGRVLVTAQLIDPATDVHLWSDSFNREFADIFAIQADIAMNIANALEAEFSVAEQESLAARPTESAPAYALYLKAITAIEDPSVDDDPDLHEQFHRDLDQAIALDPDFALAHAYKALAYATSTGGVLRVEDEPTRGERARLAREHAERALALDPNVGLAHSALARLHEFYLRRTEAAQAYERAYELSPNDPNLLIDYSIFLSKSGQPEAALQISRPLMELSPGWGHFLVAFNLIIADDYEAALVMAREAARLVPTRTLVRAYLGFLEAANGDEQAALEELRIAETLSRSDFAAPFVLATLAEGYGVIGLRGDARRILERIQAMGAQYSIGNASLGLAYLAADDEENALDWLTRAADDELPDEGVFLESTLWANVYADPVLEQPEFVEVRSRLGFRDL